MKLKLKINLIVLGITLIIFIICTSTTYFYTKKWAEQISCEIVKNKSEASTILVKTYFTDAINKVESLRDLIYTLKSNNVARRNDYRDIVRQTLENNKNFLSVWTQFEPNTMDNLDDLYKDSVEYGNRGRFSHAFYKSNDKIQFQLQPKYKDEDSLYFEDYYLKPKISNALTIIEPYMYDYVGDKKEEFFETSIAIPFHNENGKVIGVIGVDLDLAPLQKAYSDIKLYESGYCQLISNEGIIVTSNDPLNLKHKTNDFLDQEILSSISTGKSLLKIIEDPITKNEYIVNYTPISFGKNLKPWFLSFKIPNSEVFAETNKILTIVVLTELLCLVILSIVVYIFALNISNPLIRGIKIANKISQGVLTSNIENEKGSDEIATLINSLKNMSDKISDVIRDFSDGTNNINYSGKELNEISKKIASGASIQYTAAKDTSSAIYKISYAIKTTAENARNTESIYKKIVADLNRGYYVVDKTLEQMSLINEKVKVLNEIASQTNILALNAAVESARAGVHGKGFSVIATEVRKLAEKSSSGANEIIELTNESLKISLEARNLMYELLPAIEKIVKLINEIAIANIEQENDINQINETAKANQNVIEDAQKLSFELSNTADNLLKRADQLRKQLNFFQIK